MMNTLDRDAQITLTDGHTYQFVRQSGPLIQLRRDDSGAVVEYSSAELSRVVVGTSPVFEKSPRTLESMPHHDQKGTLFLAGHLEEIITGHNPQVNRSLPEYDIATTTQEQRIQRKVRDLTAAGLPASRATLHRKLAAYRARGSSGLIDERKLRQHPPLEELDYRVHEALAEAIAEAPNESTRTLDYLITQTRKKLIMVHAPVAPTMPSRSSMYRYINYLGAGKYLKGSAKQRQTAALTPDRTLAHHPVLVPGEQVQIDSTPLGVMVRVGKKMKRLHLTIFLDIATRSIMSFGFHLEGAKSADHALLLIQAVTPMENRPDKSGHRDLVQLAFGTKIDLLSADEHARAWAQRPLIFPRCIVTDNGRDFLGRTFHNVARSIGCQIVLSAPHTPTDKAEVERTFRSIETLFSQYLPGYIGSSPDNRGSREPQLHELLDQYAVYELFEDWVINVWQNRPHSGLADPLDRRTLLSPNQMAARAADFVAQISLPMTRDDYIEALPSEWRIIDATGISFNKRDYDSNELHPLRRTRSSDTRNKGKWEIKFDPYNLQRVWLRGPESWIECRTRDCEIIDMPFAEDLMPRDTAREDLARHNARAAGSPIHDDPIEPTIAAPSDYDVTDFEVDDIVLTTVNDDEDS